MTLVDHNRDHDDGPVEVLPFAATDLCVVRALVRRRVRVAGLIGDRVDHMVLAVHEVAACAVAVDSKPAVLRIRQRRDAVVCEVHEAGGDPGPGRRRPEPRLAPDAVTPGRGLWIARALCDDVDVTIAPDGGARVRMTMAYATPEDAAP